MTLRFLHTADLHLGAPFPSLGEQAAGRQAAFLTTFERLLTLAIKKDVHLFLVAGDLFDSPHPDPTLVARVQAGLKRLADRGIVTVLLPGTHDNLVAPDAVYRQAQFPGVLLAAPKVEEPVTVTVGGTSVHLYGFAFRSSASTGALATMARRPTEGFHVGLLHGSRQGSPEWDYRQKDLPFTLEMLRSWNLDYVALGHYHGFEVLEEGGRAYACYPGSPEGKRFGENGPRHAALVSLTREGAQIEQVTVHSQWLETRTLDLAGCDTIEGATAAVRALGHPDLLLRLTLTGIVEAPLDLNALQLCARDAFYHLEFDDRTRLFDSALAARIEKEETVRGVFVRRARRLLEELPPEQRPAVEEAFREVLTRFHAFGGGGA
ncbi:MAG: DNA repair exonuclease [Desulfuromonadales bacterium]|nr:DNA repair exonuclease [Desulfuromonadales bacterium]